MKTKQKNKKAPISVKKIKEPISNKIVKAISEVKKISERIVGYLPYEIEFVKAKYSGRTQRPAKITALEKGIIGILLIDDFSSFERIGAILGLDVVNDKAEKAILTSAINTLRGFNAIEGDDSCIALTENGRTYAEKGERPDSYTSTFELYINPQIPNWLNIKPGIGKYTIHIKEINTPINDLGLSLDQIKAYAEYQATNVHFPQERFLLESAVWVEGNKATYRVYVCFVQNVANSNDIRAFVFDENSNSINNEFTDQINSDESLKRELLNQCIELECKTDADITILADEEIAEAIAEIPEEIKIAEQRLIKEEAQEHTEHANDSADDPLLVPIVKLPTKDRLRKKALYDSLSFELELQRMFSEDEADEIWLISPWIHGLEKKTRSVFIEERGPMIERLLSDEDKRVFVAYSAPSVDRSGKPKVDENGNIIYNIDDDVKAMIENLEATYPNFYFAELPEFHVKNVIEVKGDQKILFSGSFNVLSFSVSEKQTHIRREEMTLAHHAVAKKKYEDYLLEFAQTYAKRIRNEIESLTPQNCKNFKNEKLEYFLSIDNSEINKLFTPLQDMIEELTILLFKEEILNRLTILDQKLVVAKNLGGINPKDKKSYDLEFSSITKVIKDNLNLSDDPAVEDHLRATKEKIENLQIKAIFPGKMNKGSKRPQNRNIDYSSPEKSSLLPKARDIMELGVPASKEDLWNLLLSLLYLFLQREITKVELQNQVKHIVCDLPHLYDGLKIEPSRNNDEASNVTLFIDDKGISLNNLFFGNKLAECKKHEKFARIQRINWVNNKNIELEISKI